MTDPSQYMRYELPQGPYTYSESEQGRSDDAARIRAAIQSRPTSQQARAMLIQEAIEYDMADEIPEDWVIEFYNPEGYEDTQDLIADYYRVVVREYRQGNALNLEINAHESGAVSIRILPHFAPIAKFDIPTADRLIEMLTNVEYLKLGVNRQIYGESAPTGTGQLSEPTTGIIYNQYEGTLTFPAREQTPEISIYFLSTIVMEELITGLTAMANSAETYATSQQEIK